MTFNLAETTSVVKSRPSVLHGANLYLKLCLMLTSVQCRVKKLGHSRIVQLSFTLHLSNVLLVLRSSERWLEKVITVCVFAFVRDLFVC